MHNLRLLLLLPLAVAGICCKWDSGNGNTAQAYPSQQEETTPQDFAEEKIPAILTQTGYTAADSAKVVSLLNKETGQNDVLFYARHFRGTPYVGGTLEVGKTEKLIVNLRQMDCATYAETVLALAMTHRQGSRDFAAFCQNLMSLRYRDGLNTGYLSRLHYFTWWMHDNMARGIIAPVTLPDRLTTPLHVNNYYMSRNAEKYPHLKGNTARIDSIRRMEQAQNGSDGRYLPAAQTHLSRKELPYISDGDLIAIVTRKKGLDYSHLGFAVWGKDGHLHLLNASQLHRQVVEEPKPLHKYLKEHPTSIGIRLWRLAE